MQVIYNPPRSVILPRLILITRHHLDVELVSVLGLVVSIRTVSRALLFLRSKRTHHGVYRFERRAAAEIDR